MAAITLLVDVGHSSASNADVSLTLVFLIQ